jgi:O-antigen ligase
MERTPRLHRWLDAFSGAAILFLVVWAPWALGCTIPWAETVLLAGCFVLGAAWAGKQLVRWRFGYRPARWVEPSATGRWAVRGLALLSVMFLLWGAVGVWNAHSDVELTRVGPVFRELEHPPLAWLPATRDRWASAREVPRFLAYALAFWAIRDWLLGKTRREKHAPPNCPFPTQRLRWLLWTLAVSSGLLALVGILHRLDGSNKLLWLVEPYRNQLNEFQFATYPYRANAAQYFNLVWPVILGFWWALHAQNRRQNPRARFGNEAALALLPLIGLMVAAPIVATSRGGALVLAGMAGLVVVVTSLQRRVSWGVRAGLGAALVGALVLGWMVGGEAQQKRFATVMDDNLSGRVEIYRTARNMTHDAGWLGLGADSFKSLNFLYRENPEEKWQGYVHDDWLELRICLGLVGLLLALGLLGGVVAVWGSSVGPGAPGVFAAFTAIAIGGMLLHAKFDFPFQVESLRFLFVTVCAVWLCAPNDRR